MFSTTLLVVSVITLLLAWYWWRRNGRRKGLKQIPGPRGLPIAGNIRELTGTPQHAVFNKWTKEFGDIYQFKFGLQSSIMISDIKMAKEMFLQDANYMGRPRFEAFEQYFGEPIPLGIINAEGKLWEVHRRFLLRQLRDFGFGKSGMETLILEELNEVIAKFKESEGKPVVDIKKIMTIAVINSLWIVVGGTRFQHDDPKLLTLVENTLKAFEDLMTEGFLFLLLPWLQHIAPEWCGFNKVRKVFDDQRIFFEETLEEHKRTFDDNNHRDFIDVYLSEMKKTTDPNSEFYGGMAERQLVTTLADLFFAGSDTTSTTLAWTFLYLCKYPEVQKKLQEEITAVTNNSRNVSLADKPNMPYTLALMDEILRFSSIVPNGVAHRALDGKEFQGYWIPKDTWIMLNMHHIHHDPKLWGDPENFRPERFLSEDGKKYIRSDSLIPFQLGRRMCVGETLARDTFFLFLTNIFQRFDISFDPSVPEPTTDVKLYFLLNPFPFSVIMKDRQDA